VRDPAVAKRRLWFSAQAASIFIRTVEYRLANFASFCKAR
jgi:hypothetical protein